MKRYATWALAAWPLLAGLTHAQYQAPGGPPISVDVGLNPRFKVSMPQDDCAPWYTYWPAEAWHKYGRLAPMPFPYWPNPAAQPAPAAPNLPAPNPLQQPPGFNDSNFGGPELGPTLTPAAYHPAVGRAPSYWYGR